MKCLGLHNKPTAEVHPGHMLTDPKEEEEKEDTSSHPMGPPGPVTGFPLPLLQVVTVVTNTVLFNEQGWSSSSVDIL
jgi:hypothetical protein